jgi:hypothetical protein
MFLRYILYVYQREPVIASYLHEAGRNATYNSTTITNIAGVRAKISRNSEMPPLYPLSVAIVRMLYSCHYDITLRIECWNDVFSYLLNNEGGAF